MSVTTRPTELDDALLLVLEHELRHGGAAGEGLDGAVGEHDLALGGV